MKQHLIWVPVVGALFLQMLVDSQLKRGALPWKTICLIIYWSVYYSFTIIGMAFLAAHYLPLHT